MFQNIKNFGPLPEGKYTLNKADIDWRDNIIEEIGWGSGWGKVRGTLIPDSTTQLFGRSGFFLHGSLEGNGYGSQGCIDLGVSDNYVFSLLEKQGASKIEVLVEYSDFLSGRFHPVYADDQKFGDYMSNVADSQSQTGIAPSKLLSSGQTVAPDYCFSAGTEILTPDGVKKIEEIVAGDIVLAFDASVNVGRGALLPSRVVRTFVHKGKEIVEMGGVKVTPDHQFLTDKGFKPLSACGAMDHLVKADGTLTPFLGIKQVSGVHSVYNFEVEGVHSYIADGYRVHNDCLRDGDILEDVNLNASGHLIINATNSITGAEVSITEKPIAGGNIILQRIESYDDGSATAIVTLTYDQFDANKNPIDEPDVSLTFKSQVYQGEVLGDIFGSQLGALIAGDNVFAQVAGATVGATLAGNIAEYGQSLLADVKRAIYKENSALSFANVAVC